ncbi:MAG: histidine kinase [Burkholderiaceae bacterium]|jgi:two-component system sensor histidine kinase UhpB
MSLRLKINLVLSVFLTVFLATFIYFEIDATRSSVHEEIEASNRVAIQLLTRISLLFQVDDPAVLAEFLRQTGRVRANDIVLYDESGRPLHVSPAPTYKQGRDAPEWFARLVSPDIRARRIELPRAQLVITPNASRAILDGWDGLRLILYSGAPAVILASSLMFWLIGRWLAPLERIQGALYQMERGDHSIRLPPLAGKEAREMGRAFNRMAQAVDENLQARQAAAEARALLIAQREFTQVLQERIEEERRALARELHDDLGQSLTAIRTISQSIAMQAPEGQTALQRSAHLLGETASSMYDAMHRMIPRLRPSALDELGLVEAVRDLVSDTQLNHPDLAFRLEFDETMPVFPGPLQISAYRIIQEAITNVLRHANAKRVSVRLAVEQESFVISVQDDGQGSKEVLERPGHYGVRGMRERAEALGGVITFSRSSEGGLAVLARLPLALESST